MLLNLTDVNYTAYDTWMPEILLDKSRIQSITDYLGLKGILEQFDSPRIDSE